MSRIKYNEDSITVLKGLEAVRKRPGMYIGGANADGLYHLFKEIFDNAVDETVAAKSKYIGIELNGQTTKISDAGRGIPVGKHKDAGISTLTVIFTILHAGGKFGDSGYNASVGVNGVGAAVVNALSSELIIETTRNNLKYVQKFSKGDPVGPVRKSKKGARSILASKAVTNVHFTPDKEIFGNLKIDRTRIEQAVRVAAYFNKGVSFYFLDRDKGSKPTKYISKNGLLDYHNELRQELKAENQAVPFIWSSSDADIVLSWIDKDDEKIMSYVSSSRTEFGGVHTEELNKIITDVIRSLGGKRAEKIAPRLFRSGLLALVNVRVNQPVFDSQTKSRLVSTEAKKMVAACLPALEKYFKSNKTLIKAIVDRAEAIGKAEADFKLSRKAAARINGPRGKSPLPKKLVVSNTRDPKKRELFIVEGDSASGSGKRARDPAFQEVLALRGKIINPYKSTDAKVFDSEAIISILQAIGYNPNSKDPLENLRVGRIILLSDADEDGKHINSLTVSLLVKYMPKLFDMGKVFAIDAPLYKTRVGNKNVYGYSLSDMNKIKGKTGKPTRFKGWGESNADELRDIAFDLQSRKLIQLSSVGKTEKDNIKNVIGENVSVRKKMLGLEE